MVTANRLYVQVRRIAHNYIFYVLEASDVTERKDKVNVMMEKTILKLAFLCICVSFICSGCGKKTEKQAEKQTVGENGLVTMSATVTEDDSTTLACTIVNKTKKDIVIGDAYSLQVLKDKSFVDVPLLPEANAFNLLSRDILSGDEYSYRAYIETNYGELEAGRYRIVIEYTNKEKSSQKKENTSKETVTAEFDLP
jgi:hypothetical protein